MVAQRRGSRENKLKKSVLEVLSLQCSVPIQAARVYIHFKFFLQPFSVLLMQCATCTHNYSTDKPAMIVTGEKTESLKNVTVLRLTAFMM